MKTITYGRMDEVMRSLGFSSRTKEDGARIYKLETGARLIIPSYPDDEPLLDRHRHPARMQASFFGISEAAAIDNVTTRRPA